MAIAQVCEAMCCSIGLPMYDDEASMMIAHVVSPGCCASFEGGWQC